METRGAVTASAANLSKMKKKLKKNKKGRKNYFKIHAPSWWSVLHPGTPELEIL